VPFWPLQKTQNEYVIGKRDISYSERHILLTTKRVVKSTDPFQANPLGRGQLADFPSGRRWTHSLRPAPVLRWRHGRRSSRSAKLVREARCYRQSGSGRLENQPTDPAVCLLLVTRCPWQDKDRLSASPPCTRLRIEAPWKLCTAKLAAAASIQIPASKLIPIAFDKHLTARRAISRIVFYIVDITDVNVM
jgi:hypothetical protein